MSIIVFVSILALILASFDSAKKIKGGLALAFIIITTVAAIRYDYGNDYMSYYDNFLKFSYYNIRKVLNGSIEVKEPGWTAFCILFSIFGRHGYFIMLAVISVFCNWVYYRFIVENVERRYYWLALFIYLFTFDMYVLQMSMIRQGLTIALFVYSYHFIKKKDLLIPILLSALAFTFHKSSIIFIPFILLSKIDWNSHGKTISFVLLGSFILFFISNSIVEMLYGDVMSLETMESYEGYQDWRGNKTGIRRILEFIPFFVALIYIAQQKNNKQGHKFLVMLSTVTTIMYPFTMMIHLISRLTFYFGIYYIASIPITYFAIKNKVIRYSLLSTFLLVTLYMYFDCFNSKTYMKPFAEYQTIFNVL